MHWEKKICFRLTLRRIVGAVLMAGIVANLIIVGAVFGADSAQAAPTLTSTLTSDLWTATFFVFTATAGEMPTATQTATATQTLEPALTDTPTATQTPTNTDQPVATLCVVRFEWPAYRVKRGDTLFSLAIATGSTVHELVSANCLESDRIIAGQLLYLPRLPVEPTPTDTLTSEPKDSPTGFEILESMTCDPPAYVAFSVKAYDPEEISSISVLVYSGQDTLISEIPMDWNGANYSGWTSLSEPYTVADIAYYQFRAVDRLGNVTISQTYRERSSSCVVVQQGFQDGGREAR